MKTLRLKASETYRVQVTLEGVIGDRDRARVSVSIPGGSERSKFLHPGDPDLSLAIRPESDGNATLTLQSDPTSGPLDVRSSWHHLTLSEGEKPAIEAEPNDSWRSANPLLIGRSVYGTADDVDYLENLEEGKAGLDWFRFEVKDEVPVLVYFQLEQLDRDVSSNLCVYRLDPASGEAKLHESGKDPMEIVHDRERERYSTHLSRTLTRGTYFVEVNANHPDYILRTRAYSVPPLNDPSKAVEAGLDYLLEVGDAWFAQIPREGNIFVRSGNLHDTATRCTACHASSFPTEASLVAHANGYPIRAKSSMHYLMDRIANSPTPLYGEDGLYWQRFIAIPLQAQGKQGGILLDYERQVLGRETKEFERFGPFLQAAWRGRRLFPADEVNGVVPLDSKFGFAWRDWRVLNEMSPSVRPGRLRPGRRRHRRHPRRPRHRPPGRDLAGPDSPALRLVADRQKSLKKPDRGRGRRPARAPESRRRLARARPQAGPERGLHHGPVDLDPPQGGIHPRGPPGRPSPGLPPGPATTLRRLAPDKYA